MSEANEVKQLSKYFKQQKNKYIRKYGRKPMSNFQLEDECAALFKKWKGCYMQDELKIYKPGYYILNLDTRNKEGIHWISLVITPKSAYIFDSFGRDTNKILPILKKNLDKQGLKIIESDPDQDQKGDSVVCGMLCIAFLLCCDKFGIVKTVKVI